MLVAVVAGVVLAVGAACLATADVVYFIGGVLLISAAFYLVGAGAGGGKASSPDEPAPER